MQYFDVAPAVTVALVSVLVAVGAAARPAAGTSRWRAAGAVLLAGAVVVTVVVTLGPVTHEGPPSPASARSVNLVPFRGIRAVLASHDVSTVLLHLGGNVLLFAPVGLLLALLLRRPLVAVVLGALLSATEEALQYVVGRVADVDDVLLDVTGVVLGCAAAVIASAVACRRTTSRTGPSGRA